MGKVGQCDLLRLVRSYSGKNRHVCDRISLAGHTGASFFELGTKHPYNRFTSLL
jgi:hypothetical protein